MLVSGSVSLLKDIINHHIMSMYFFENNTGRLHFPCWVGEGLGPWDVAVDLTPKETTRAHRTGRSFCHCDSTWDFVFLLLKSKVESPKSFGKCLELIVSCVFSYMFFVLVPWNIKYFGYWLELDGIWYMWHIFMYWDAAPLSNQWEVMVNGLW